MNKKVLFAIGLCCLGMLAVLRDHDWSPRPGAVHPSSAAPGKGLTRAELAAQTAPRRTQPAEPPESVLAVQSTAVADDDRVDREGTAPPDVALWAGSIRWSGDAPREQELRIWRLNEGRALTARPDQRHSLRVERADVATWDVVGLQPGRYVAAIGDRFLMECTLVAGLNTTPVDEPPRTELLELQFLHRRSGGAVSPKHVWMMWDSPEYPTTVEITSVLFGGEGLSLTEPERWRGHVPRARLAILGWLVHGGFATKDIPPGAAASAETLDFDLGPILVLSVLDTHGNPATRQHRSAIDGVTLMCDGEAMEPVEVNYTKGVALLGMPPRADGAQAWELVIPEGYEAVSGADATQRLHGGHRYEFVLRELHESHRALRWRGAR